MKVFTIEQFKNYVLKQDSLGDVMYFLTEENIEAANEKDLSFDDELDGFNDVYDEFDGVDEDDFHVNMFDL
jgi:hypothetical protein